MTNGEGRIAFVRDWLTVYGGADRVLDAALELYPGAAVYALLYRPEAFRHARLARHQVYTSFIDRCPGGRRFHRVFLPLMPFAVEQFDLRGYDTVISMSHVVAKGALTRADQLHIAYIFTPVRYAWDLQWQYLEELGLARGLRSWLVRGVLHYLRQWDASSATRPDVLVAASEFVARRVEKAYRRPAAVIYPPVDIDRFRADRPRRSFYVTVSRLVPYKRVDLLVDAFTRLGLPLVVIGDGPERRRLERSAGPTISFLGAVSDAVVSDHLEQCRGFVFAAEEDFGIALAEAHAAGAPVVAFRLGGAAEIVSPPETGVLFHEQTVECVVSAVRRCEAAYARFDHRAIRDSVRRFHRDRFQRELQSLVRLERARFFGRQLPWDVAPSKPMLVGG